jgi:hypothetical protein
LIEGKKEGAIPGSSFKPWNGGKKAERSSTRGQERVERATAFFLFFFCFFLFFVLFCFFKNFYNLDEDGD